MQPSLAPISLELPGPYAAVVADMDGLLVHTERHWLQAKVVLFGRYGVELTDGDLAAVFGTSELDSARYFVGRFGLPAEQVDSLRHEYLEIVGDLFDRGVELTDGADELLARLSGTVPLALATNTRRSLVEKILRAISVGERFDAIVSGDEAPPKPAPDLYLLACQRLGVDPASAVALEDSPTGVTAAKRAGMSCIGVPSDARFPLHEADAVVDSLVALL
jgi:HAD superfamily hydrolase (TIGR01509 family)